MLTIIDAKDIKTWNDTVKSFKKWDVYYTHEYAFSFKIHGDGEPLLLLYEDEVDNSRFCYVVMKNDISEAECFKNAIEKGKYYDIETPYGYGGPLTDNVISKQAEETFKKEMYAYCQNNNIVSQFVRFHPLLENYNLMDNYFETRYLRDTIYMDTSSVETIWRNIESKNRNMIRKAQKNGVSIEIASIGENKDFIQLYNQTMKKNQASDYYFFEEDYFSYLKQMKEEACIFYAMYEGKPISAAIMFYNDKYMHYHLSGSDIEYRNLASSNLLLYEAAVWASEKGIEKFHLGGGMYPDDSLFGFKKQFNRNDRTKFVVGRTIFMTEKYNELMSIRKELDEQFDMYNSNLIQYRR